MLKSVAKAAGCLAYLFITLEMLFMVTPFALYYYAVYSPLLAGPLSIPATAWLPAFFLPHLSTEILPSIGGLIFLLGLVGFVLSAFQLYYVKFKRRGAVRSGFYKRIRHPQYLFLALAGLGDRIIDTFGKEPVLLNTLSTRAGLVRPVRKLKGESDAGRTDR